MNGSMKPAIIIYPQHYLTISMTFIYSQLTGIMDEYRPIVLAASTDNLDVFPFSPICLKKTSYSEKIFLKLLGHITGNFILNYPPRTKHWKDILKSHDAKLIHAHFGPSGLEILPVAKDLGLPLIVTFHGYDASSLLRKKGYVSQLKALFDYAHIIAVSKTMRERLIENGANPVKVQTHYIGVPIEDFKYIRRTPLRDKVENGGMINFLQVSNFVEKKGHEYTVRAFSNFLSVYPQSRLTLAGDGPLRKGIEALCGDLGIADKVRFLGKIPRRQVLLLMSKADIFLHHSVTADNGDEEGIPTAIMEAMATGLIVISSLHSGIPELVTDGINGFLVQERDIKGYASKMIETLNCGNEIGQQATEAVKENFNLSLQNEKLKNIYRAVLENEFAN